MRSTTPLLIAWMLSAALPCPASEPTLRQGRWRAWLDSPGGELPFGLELWHEGGRWSAWIINDPERIEVPQVSFNGSELVLDIDYYDSVIRAKSSSDGRRLDGEWTKRRGADKWLKMPFHATSGGNKRFLTWNADEEVIDTGEGLLVTPAPNSVVVGRWTAFFAQDAEAAIAVFASASEDFIGINEGGSAWRCGLDHPSRTDEIVGTFLTTTGDYRYLAGHVAGRRLQLSCFDGAHAFLFDARIGVEGEIYGDFWSGDAYYDTWMARPDPDAKLPDAFELARAAGSVKLADLAFPDIEGRRISMGDARFAGRPMVIEVFGTWCPNCRDATQYLVELDKRYRPKGLAIVGLAFELTGDAKRDAEQVKKYAARHHVEYPLLVAGVSDKAKASAALPLLDKIRAYPTLIFVKPDGTIASIYSGFSGPATGPAHDEMRARIESLIDLLVHGP